MKRKILSGLLALCLVVRLLPLPARADEAAGGNCGAEGDGGNLTWSLDDDGELSIEGEGAMADYGASVPPWYSELDEITEIKIGKKVTSIGEEAFAGCDALKSIVIPAGMASIGKNAFSGTVLETVKYRGNPDNWDSEKITIGEGNDAFKNAKIRYQPTLIRPPWVPAGAENPTLTLTFDMAFNPGTAENPDLYTISSHKVRLIDEHPASVALDSSDYKTVELRLSGSVQGELSVEIDSDAFAAPVWGTDIDIDVIWLPPDPVDPSPPPDPVTPPPDPDPDPMPDPEPDPAPPPAPVLPIIVSPEGQENASKEVVSVEYPVQTGQPPAVGISGEGESDIQGIVKEGEFADWIDRVDLPRYGLTLYDALYIGSDHDRRLDVLIEDEYNTVPGAAGSAGRGTARIESVRTLSANLSRHYSSGGGIFQDGNFTGSFDVIDITAGDRAVNYAALQEGDVVRTSNYNAIFVTKLLKDGRSTYDADLKKACAYASTAFQAFDRDHPEVFWLSGSTKMRMVTVTMQEGQRAYKETYVFFTLADSEGFTVRDPKYPNQAAVESGIQRRDQAVTEILRTISGASDAERVTQLNRWLTEHNQYNTSPDPQNLPNAPHECLSALEGSIGADGPVCDGYSRAFKVLCDRMTIPCVLVDGYALARAGGPGEFHMWNSVQMPDEQWYGVDVTWNDPTVKGVNGAKSGREREDFLLVGADTVVFGLKFSESHPPKNRAVDGGVSFINGPTLSAVSFNPLAGTAALPFTDVDNDSWCYSAVEYVFDNGLMKGTSGWEFSPDRPVTRAMVWTILARLSGEGTEGGAPWYAAARSWAVREGISDGTSPETPVTRQQLAAMLWRYAGEPESTGSLENFSDSRSVGAYAADAMRWAVEKGVITGKTDGSLQPGGTAARAHTAAMIQRFCEKARNNTGTHLGA